MMYPVSQILKSIIRKGDGNWMMWGGQTTSQRYPPPEAHRPDGEFDVPAFAHTGGHGQEDTGIPGVGHLIDGQWVMGAHGEHVWQSTAKTSEFLHGIDGIIRALGRGFEEQGLRHNPKEVLQIAIDKANAKRAPEDQIPHVDSEEWRKLHMDYRVEDGPVRGKDGKFISTLSNGPEHSKLHHGGRFMESYNNPMHEELGHTLHQIGYQKPERHSWVRDQFVKPHRLAFDMAEDGTMRSSAGGFGAGRVHQTEDEHGNMIITPDSSHIKRQTKQGLLEDTRKFQNISSWGMANLYPPIKFLRKPRGGKYPTVTQASFLHELNQAFGGSPEALANNTIVNSSGAKDYVSRIPSNVTVPIEGKNVPLKHLLSSGEAGWQQLFDSMRDVVGFQAMFGENKSHSLSGKINHYYGTLLGDNAPEGHGLEKYLTHSGRIDQDHVYQHPQSGGGWKTLATHDRARDVMAHAILSAATASEPNSPLGGIPMWEHMPEPEDLKAQGINLLDTQEHRDQIPNLREVMHHIGSSILIARGIEHPVIPDANTLAELDMHTGHALVGGTSADTTQLGVPPHIRDVGMPELMEKPGIPPITAGTPTRDPRTVAGGPLNPQAYAAATEESPFDVPGATVSRGPPNPNAQNVRVDPMTPGLTPQQQTRARVGQAPMDRVRDFMASIYGPESHNITPQRVQEFRQSYGDPYQTRIDEQPWMQKSENIVSVIESIQIDDAMTDMAVMKHVPSRSLSENSITDILLISKRMGIAPMDVRAILNSKGDWSRISKTYGYDDKTVKVVKISFGGI